ncbi:hypothetical protein [Opitutus sp. GAS368]|jgi:hypothetical protein|uniref:hypothetical protein n=1 Tax=Opitutus sp. GAS368 TaxID=1882749 RepID=UPI00087CE341|nr:hypothetical protein [Opitutus sp. GAS368]SDS29153.1 hypothetical protein SAMN05444173_2447 [Opitutus sp. GAS368]
MKTTSLLSLVLLVVLATGASAAQSQSRSEFVVLPTFLVESTRNSSVEQYIAASLDALRAQAAKPVAVSLELPALKARIAQVFKPLGAVRLAKS